MGRRSDVDISILIANYNNANYVTRAVRSCLNQLILRTQIEIIVIDDCSTDNSLNALREFQSSVVVVKNDVNMGIGYVSAKGLELAKGKYFMRVDSDDYLSNSACLIHTQILENNSHIAYSYSDIIEIDDAGVKSTIVSLSDKQKLHAHGAGVLFRTEELRKIGGYDPNLRNAEDLDVFLRLENNRKIGYHIPIPLYRYYRRPDSLTRDSDRQEMIIKVQEKNNV